MWWSPAEWRGWLSLQLQSRKVWRRWWRRTSAAAAGRGGKWSSARWSAAAWTRSPSSDQRRGNLFEFISAFIWALSSLGRIYPDHCSWGSMFWWSTEWALYLSAGRYQRVSALCSAEKTSQAADSHGKSEAWSWKQMCLWLLCCHFKEVPVCQMGNSEVSKYSGRSCCGSGSEWSYSPRLWISRSM